MLIVHGADDTNVPVGEAEQLADALAARGAAHRLLVFEGEGHDLLATENGVAFVHAVVVGQPPPVGGATGGGRPSLRCNGSDTIADPRTDER